MRKNQVSMVAVIMTCYNERAYIGAAVRSVLSQTRSDRIEQIVIADDGSDAETIEILRDIQNWDERIKIVYGAGGVGQSGLRRQAIAETSSEFFAILDGDDLWTEEKLERQLPVLEADDKVGLVYSDFYSFHEFDLSSSRRAGVLDIGSAIDLPRQYFINDPPIIPSTTLIRKSSYEECGGFDPSVRVFEDPDLFFRLARVTRFCLVNEPLLYKRNRKTSTTGGRKDLMAHHAYVSFKAATVDPKVLPLVPRRLAERARKLGNQRFLVDDHAEALALLSLAVRLHPSNFRALMSLIAIKFFPRLALRLAGSRATKRRASLGLNAK